MLLGLGSKGARWFPGSFNEELTHMAGKVLKQTFRIQASGKS